MVLNQTTLLARIVLTILVTGNFAEIGATLAAIIFNR